MRETKKPRKLRPRQMAFAKALVKTGEQRAAYYEAGYKPNSIQSADAGASLLMSQDHVRAAYLKELDDKFPNRKAVMAERIRKFMDDETLSVSDFDKLAKHLERVEGLTAPGKNLNLSANLNKPILPKE